MTQSLNRWPYWKAVATVILAQIIVWLCFGFFIGAGWTIAAWLLHKIL